MAKKVFIQHLRKSASSADYQLHPEYLKMLFQESGIQVATRLAVVL